MWYHFSTSQLPDYMVLYVQESLVYMETSGMFVSLEYGREYITVWLGEYVNLELEDGRHVHF